jgi:O-succinylbenzoic acid--CoA ligase
MTAGLRGSIPEWLRQRASISPERLALIADGTQLTYAQLSARVEAAAARLQTEDVRPGDLVALLAQNGAPYVVAVHAIARIGAVLLPLNFRLAPAELAWLLKDAAAHRLLHEQAHHETALALRGEAPPLQLISLDKLTAADSPSPPTPRPEALEGGRGPGGGAFDLASPHSVLYTSGTTGRPKGAVLTYGNHLWSATASALNLGLQPDDRWLACLPLFHVGGLSILLRSVIYGTTAVVHAGFDAARVNAAIDNEGVTIVSVVANMLQRLLDERGDRPYPPTLRCVLLGGGPAPEALLRRCAALGVPVVQTYGLTETASQIATLAPEDALRKLGSAGKPLFGGELRIVSDDGAGCPPGVAGEIVVRGPTVTPGYLNRPAETAATIRGGWLHTGDLGHLDSESYLYVLDRRDDLIVSGGENVYPAEIEAVLHSHPDVLEAGIYAVADARWGKSPAAIVVLRAGAPGDAPALIAFCRQRLAAYKTPCRIDFAVSLPRNAAGKLLRRDLHTALTQD